MSQRLQSLQALRGFAALVVVLMHFGNFLSVAAPTFSGFLKHGALGVDVFFVISGFIIYLSTTESAAREPAGFFIRRFCRVVVPAWAAMVLFAATRPPYLHDLLYGLAFIPLKNSDAPFYGYSFLIVAWTLTYELIFYAIFAAVLCLRVGRRYRGLMSSAAILVMVFAMQGALGTFTFDAHSAPLARGWGNAPMQLLSLSANPILIEFILGIFLAWCWKIGLFSRSDRATAALLFVGAALIYFVLTLQYSPGHGVTRGGLFAFLAVSYGLVLQSLIDKGGAAKLPWHALLAACAALGECSYSLYLTHPAIKSLLARVPWLGPSQPGAAATFVLAIAASVLLAVAFHRWVELPSQSLGRRLAKHHENHRLKRGRLATFRKYAQKDTPWS